VDEMKKKPKFLRQNWRSYKRLRKTRWRKPRGIHSKMRRWERGKGKLPSPGYGSPLRYMHPSGFREILVHNVKELDKVDEKIAVKIAHAVGKRKRQDILKKAEEKKVKVLNP
jgi:large subunit ribosomal protein L32e